MRVLLQRVKSASVSVGGEVLGEIGKGLLAFVGFAHTDDEPRIRWMCEKVLALRIFEDEAGKMNLSVADVGGGILVVSQFTLYGDASKGNRPSFTGAAPPELAERLYDDTVRTLRGMTRLRVETGRFRAEMAVSLVNDGPVTILLEKQ